MKPTKEKRMCCVEGCDRPSKLTADFCARCYMRARYWTHKSPTEKMLRIRQLRMWESGMSYTMPGVTIMRKRKHG